MYYIKPSHHILITIYISIINLRAGWKEGVEYHKRVKGHKNKHDVHMIKKA